jgi:hypothetical protein
VSEVLVGAVVFTNVSAEAHGWSKHLINERRSNKEYSVRPAVDGRWWADNGQRKALVQENVGLSVRARQG